MGKFKVIRTVFVNPKSTSALAFDGSGKVVRNAKKDLCMFPTGKVYHADLNASYNIGTRYNISCILKPLPFPARLQLQTKVPDAAGRTS